jgi:hypothetical protein
MKTPQIFVAYSPRGVGLRCAVAYLKDAKNVYGWFTGPRDGLLASAYFLLEGFYAGAGTRFLATESSDAYGGWTWDYSSERPERIGPEKVDEVLCHRLVHLQDAFVHEWLAYRTDAGAAADLAQYEEAELAIGDVNLRFARLNRLAKLHATWTFYSQDFEASVARYLMRRWPLEYRGE